MTLTKTHFSVHYDKTI